MDTSKRAVFDQKNVKIKPKLISAFIAAGLIPLLIVVFIMLNKAEANLMSEAFSKLSAVQMIKENQISNYLNGSIEDVKVAAASTDAQLIFSELKAYHIRKKVGVRDPYPITDEYDRIHEKYDWYLHYFVDTYGYHDAFIICTTHGHVMYSVAKESDLGENLASGDLNKSGLGDIWRKVKETGEVSMTDMALYAPSNNEPAMFVGSPLKDENGEMIGLLALQIKVENMNKVMQERSGMAETGETYLVGSDRLMRSDSYLDPVKHSVLASIPGTLQENGVDTDASRNALEGEQGTEIINDYNGNRVLSSYSPIDLPGGIRWAVIAEIDEAEVLEPINDLRNIAIIIALILSLCIGIFAFWMALSISKPIEEITDLAKDVAVGKLDTKVEFDREDEIGHLAIAMSAMTITLKGMNSEVVNQSQEILKGNFHSRNDVSKFSGDYRILMEGINDLTDQFASQTGESINIINKSLQDLSVSSKEISTTSNQQAVAVKEIVSTMEDSEKLARGIASKIDEVVKISKKTEGDVEKGFSIIKSSLEQMGQINVTNDCSIEGIKLLGQQIESIWEIVSMINSVADQTKIIAFNAELEASKTGESGKNFEIVASEIRRLADNTVDSTKDIKSKIHEIQKSSDNLILSSEAGTEKIKEGLKLSNELETVFSAILNSSEITASSAEQIALSINQQASSFEQILIALKQISEGIDNFVASTSSTTQAVHGLESMLESLNEKL